MACDGDRGRYTANSALGGDPVDESRRAGEPEPGEDGRDADHNQQLE
jgi:hypothetical protein